MNFIPVVKINEVAAGLTQAGFSGMQGGDLIVGAPSMPLIFTRTFMASMTGDYLFEVGASDMDPVLHTRLLMQYASDHGIPFAQISEDYLGLLTKFGLSSEPFRKIVSKITGPNDRPTRLNSIAPVTPTFVFEIVERIIPQDTSDVLAYLVTDYVCSKLRPIGWIIKDAPLVYRMRRTHSFPHFQDLVDVLHAKELYRVIQIMADSDLSLVKQAMEKKAAILPTMIAQHLTNAVTSAIDMAKGTYDAEAVTISTLSLMARIWNPQLPAEMQPRDRLRNHPVVAELRSNLAVFIAVQDMIRSGRQIEIMFSDEEMSAVILPMFAQAMAEVSPYSVRILEDVVSHIGKKSTKNHVGQPGHVILFESWDFSTDVSAFVRIRQTADGKQGYLRPQTPVTSALSAAMKPVRAAFDMDRLVDRRLATLEMVQASARLPKGGTQLLLGLPSITELEARVDIKMGELFPAVLRGGVDSELDPAFATLLKLTGYDYYSILMHLAVSKAMSVTTSTVRAHGGGEFPYLVLGMRTQLASPVGASPIEYGNVLTVEPMEAIVYAEDFTPSTQMKAKSLPLDEFDSGLHMWAWHDASARLDLVASYSTNVRNQQYNVSVDEHEMLGLGVRRQNVRYLRPTMARAVARVWFSWLLEDKAYLEASVAGTNDTLMIEGFRGRMITNAMQLVMVLSQIGSSGAGASASSFIARRIADAMYEKGTIDDYEELHVGIQRHRLNVWAGLVALQLLSLLETDDTLQLIDYLEETDALAMLVGTSQVSV